jgi:uncharacterized protein (DUF362 family)
MRIDEPSETARIEESLTPEAGAATRRTFLAAAGAMALPLLLEARAEAAGGANEAPSLAAVPPDGFRPFQAPGKVVKVVKKDSLQANQLYPKPEDAKAMLTRVMTELTGKPDLVASVKEFVHPKDKVLVKVNGIARENMGTNKELVLPFIEALIAAGVPANQITVLEQYSGFLAGTRITPQNLPAGVQVAIHQNGKIKGPDGDKENPAMVNMPERLIPGTGTRTKFVRPLTEATAAFNFALVKDHSICGFTGALKNMTHGCSINPHDFHVHNASPQIALMYAQDVIKSRVRLSILDGYKVMANGGPLWKMPQHVKPHEAVYASTDPVALDMIGWEVVEKYRAELGLKTLTDDKRAPVYIKTAGELGLGVADRARIQLKEVTI